MQVQPKERKGRPEPLWTDFRHTASYVGPYWTITSGREHPHERAVAKYPMVYERCGRMQRRKNHQRVRQDLMHVLDRSCERLVGWPGEAISNSPNTGRSSPRANWRTIPATGAATSNMYSA